MGGCENEDESKDERVFEDKDEDEDDDEDDDDDETVEAKTNFFFEGSQNNIGGFSRSGTKVNIVKLFPKFTTDFTSKFNPGNSNTSLSSGNSEKCDMSTP